MSFKEDKIEKLQEIAQSVIDPLQNQSQGTEYELKDDESRKRQVKENGVTDSKKLHLDADSKTKSYPQVLFLGTGAAIPSKYRNVSATLLFLRFVLLLLTLLLLIGRFLRFLSNSFKN